MRGDMMKKCSKCNVEKELSEFNKNKKTRDGHSCYCRECSREYGRKRYEPKKKNNSKLYELTQTGMMTCSKCGIKKLKEDFHKSKTNKLGYTTTCKECNKKRSNEYAKSHKEYYKEYQKENAWKYKRTEPYSEKYLKMLEDKSYKESLLANGLMICIKCRSIKPVSSFGIDKGRWTGYTRYCKYCSSEYQKESRRNNPDLLKKKFLFLLKKEFFAKKKKAEEESKLEKAKWLEDHKEELEKARKERKRESDKRYRQTEKGRISAKLARYRRRQRRKGNGGSFTKEQWQQALEFFDYKCAYSGKPLTEGNGSIDHIYPLSKGGTNNINNLVPCDFIVNSKKCDKDFDEWYPQQEFYSKKRLKRIQEWIQLKTEISFFE